MSCTEKQVSICAKDSGGPYHEAVVNGLVAAAQAAGVDFAVDVYPLLRLGRRGHPARGP